MGHKTPIIIDTDPGVDDITAILFALASPEVEILAYIASYGNTNLDASYLNILKAYQALERNFEQYPSEKQRFPNFSSPMKPILARGSCRPLEGEVHLAQYFHGRDGLGEITERHPDLNVPVDFHTTQHSQLVLTEKSGVDVALDLIRERPPRSITYIALGPLTNLAHMVRQDGNLVRSRVGRIMCMGGALDVPGNTTPVAEFNFFADPFAVKELLLPFDQHVGLPLDRFLMVPLDVTALHKMPFVKYKEQVDPSFASTTNPSTVAGKSPLTHFTSSFLERAREVMQQFGSDSMELLDIVAVWCAMDNPPERPLADGWKAGVRSFDIERMGELTRGMLVVDRREDESAYAPGANRALVQAELERRDFKPPGPWESTANPVPVEVEIGDLGKQPGPGVQCVTCTPGEDRLLELLFRRIWGVA